MIRDAHSMGLKKLRIPHYQSLSNWATEIHRDVGVIITTPRRKGPKRRSPSLYKTGYSPTLIMKTLNLDRPATRETVPGQVTANFDWMTALGPHHCNTKHSVESTAPLRTIYLSPQCAIHGKRITSTRFYIVWSLRWWHTMARFGQLAPPSVKQHT